MDLITTSLFLYQFSSLLKQLYRSSISYFYLVSYLVSLAGSCNNREDLFCVCQRQVYRDASNILTTLAHFFKVGSLQKQALRKYLRTCSLFWRCRGPGRPIGRWCRKMKANNKECVTHLATTVDKQSFIPLEIYRKWCTPPASKTSQPRDEGAGLLMPNTQQSLLTVATPRYQFPVMGWAQWAPTAWGQMQMHRYWDE